MNNKLFWVVVIAVIAAVAGGFLFWRGAASAQATTVQATFAVARGPLTISIIQSGTIKAREMTIIKNEVEGRTSVISLIPEGTRVKKGDLLVELDASTLVDNRLDQQIRVQNAEASYVGSKENLEVVKNQAQSDVDKATLALQFAREDLQKYIDGEYPNELKRAEANITLAQEELTRVRETLQWSRRLFEEKFISQTELQADELNEKKRTLDLDLARNNLNLLTEFTYKRNLAQLESDVSQAEMALERITRKARADVIQAEADLMAKESEYLRQKDRLRKFEEQIKKAKIYAPTDGLVIYATSAQTGGRRFDTTPLIEGREVREREELIYLPTTASAKAEVSIHESNLEKIRLGLPVIITVDALPGRKFLGRLATIAPLPDAQSMWMNPDLKVYNTEIFLEDNDETLRTGMSCQAEIIAATYDDCLYVPVQSVIQVGRQPTVFVVKGKVVEERRIEMGLDNNRMVHIISGVSAGEEVLLAPPLRAGTMDPGTVSTSSDRDAIQQRVQERLNNASAPQPDNRAEGTGMNARTESAPQGQPGADESPRTDETPREGRRPEGQTMTPEQREQLRQRMEQMTPEQREQMRQRRQGGGAEGQSRPQRPTTETMP
jgi:HlyD family secretion protein